MSKVLQQLFEFEYCTECHGEIIDDCADQPTGETLFICAWCMPKGIPGSHGICPKCLQKAGIDINAH